VRAHRRRRTDTAGKCRQNYWKQRRKQIGQSAPTKGTIPAASSVITSSAGVKHEKRRETNKKTQREGKVERRINDKRTG
jgi:hypothetical protein